MEETETKIRNMLKEAIFMKEAVGYIEGLKKASMICLESGNEELATILIKEADAVVARVSPAVEDLGERIQNLDGAEENE